MQRLIAVCCLAASGALRINAGLAPTDDAFEGRITAASKSAVSIVDKQGENVTFLIGVDCKITRDGKPTEAMMLGVGDRVTVVGRDESGKFVAVKIDAYSVQQPVSLSVSQPPGP
ncbi:MAG: hypothetical protein QM775_21715 [Pirellulales bacterium]